jgi:hypothetical protein
LVKATLEFTLPEEEIDFRRAVRADDVLAAVEEFGAYLREQWKYTEPKDRADLAAIRDEWFRCFGDLLELP